MGEVFKCVFGFMTKSACAAMAVWVLTGIFTFLPPTYWPEGVRSMSENIAGWVFIVFLLASSIILSNLFRLGVEVVTVIRKRNQAAAAFSRLSPASRALVIDSYDTKRGEFFGDIHQSDISALVRYGFANYVGITYVAGNNVTDRFELSPMARDLLENRRNELIAN